MAGYEQTDKRKAQDKWIAMLRSGEYAQCKGTLLHTGPVRKSYCCLGVAAVMCGLDDDAMEGMSNLGGTDFAIVMATLGLRDKNGSFSGYVVFNDDCTYRVEQALPSEGSDCLITSFVSLNDDASWSFKEIADFAEKHRDICFV